MSALLAGRLVDATVRSRARCAHREKHGNHSWAASEELLSRGDPKIDDSPDVHAPARSYGRKDSHDQVRGGPMGNQTNVEIVNRMTKAIFDQDHDTLAAIFTDDLVFHLRGPHPMTGDHAGLGGLLNVLGAMFEMTGGRIDLDQQFCIGEGDWAAEWEHATLGRPGDDETLTSRNAFVYRFEDGRVAEMWMFLGALPEDAEAFFS
jgi:ketosteroid isomerase-like protein